MTAWFFGNMLWAGVTMLIVLAVRRPAAQLFGAGPVYALWLLPALRLVLPPMPAIMPEAAPWLAPTALVVPVAEAAAPAGGGSALPLLLAIWAAGSAAFLLWQWLLYRRFLTRLSLSSRRRGAPSFRSAATGRPCFDRRRARGASPRSCTACARVATGASVTSPTCARSSVRARPRVRASSA